MRRLAKTLLLLLLVVVHAATVASGHRAPHRYRHHRRDARTAEATLTASPSDAPEEDTGSSRRVPEARRMADVEEVGEEEEEERSTRTSDSQRGVSHVSSKRFGKMLEKAVLRIITGELSASDMRTLQSMNYSPEKVMAIREREFQKRKSDRLDEELRRSQARKDLESARRRQELEARRIAAPQRGTIDANSTSDRAFRSRRVDASSSADISRKANEESVEPSDSLSLEKRVYDSIELASDLDAFNRQAEYDYENAAPRMEIEQALEYEDPAREIFDVAMEPYVVFRIRYDDSELDSSSDERSKGGGRESSTTTTTTTASTASLGARVPLARLRGGADEMVEERVLLARLLGSANEIVEEKRATKFSTTTVRPTSERLDSATTVERKSPENVEGRNGTEVIGRSPEKDSMYEGLEWVEGDVYRVIPGAVDYSYDSVENDFSRETSELNSSFSRENLYDAADVRRRDDGNDDLLRYQNDPPSPEPQVAANESVAAAENPTALNATSAFQQLVLVERARQSQKAIEDIKQKVLAMTGRTDANTRVGQRLTMVTPTCQVPRNTDPETWSSPLSMNLHFQMNLTSSEHLAAAKLRLFKLPQENATYSDSGGTYDEDSVDEKKIRISVYFYTKSLKRHRSKKRLMDSVVTSLTPQGSHLVLDVRQGLRYWRQPTRGGHGSDNNHGLVVQVEDQDGRPVKPGLYLQQPSCLSSDRDDKTNNESLHFSSEPVLVTFAS